MIPACLCNLLYHAYSLFLSSLSLFEWFLLTYVTCCIMLTRDKRCKSTNSDNAYFARIFRLSIFSTDMIDTSRLMIYAVGMSPNLSFDGYLDVSISGLSNLLRVMVAWSGVFELLFEFFYQHFFWENGLVWGLLNAEFWGSTYW